MTEFLDKRCIDFFNTGFIIVGQQKNMSMFSTPAKKKVILSRASASISNTIANRAIKIIMVYFIMPFLFLQPPDCLSKFSILTFYAALICLSCASLLNSHQ